jgi:hypothetical protein
MLAGAWNFFNGNEFQPSGVWLPPPKHRNSKACKQENDPDADFYPVSDRRDISLNNLIHRPPVQQVRIEVPDFSLDKAVPQFAVAIDAQIDCDDASDDFIKEKLHSSIRSSRPVTSKADIVRQRRVSFADLRLTIRLYLIGACPGGSAMGGGHGE